MDLKQGTLIAALALVAAGCARDDDGVVTIGAAGPWAVGYGIENRRGIDLAVEQINARGLIPGRTLRVDARNDAGTGSAAVPIAQAFVDDPRVVAVVGHANSGAMVAAARVYDGQLPAVATTASSPDLSGVSPWVFRVISSDSVNATDLARFAGRLGRRRAAILYENNSYGRGLAVAFRRSFEGTVVSVDPVPEGTSDVEPFVSYFVRVAHPDIVFVAGSEQSGLSVLREAHRQHLAADFLGSDGWTGIVTDTATAEGAYVGAPFTPSDTRPEAQRFVAGYRKKYGGTPDANAALAYDATMLVARAIAAVGPSRSAIRDYLAERAGQDGYVGATGPIAFRTNGDPEGRGYVMTRVRRGDLLVAAQ